MSSVDSDVDSGLAAALAPVLKDLATTCAVVLEVRDAPWALPEPSAMIYDASGSGSGVSMRESDDLDQRVAAVADQVQEAAIEALWRAGLPVSWPPCLIHPDTHPLEPVVAERAVWRCPQTGRSLSAIGSLDDHASH
ncbi:MAG: hypothetical protein JWL83_4316 [Actinomycetia bacterium]|nr:hypothetical protein [Actinomycetes bacterium]